MDYNQTIAWLFTQLPMYQRVGTDAFKKNLDNIIELCEYLGNPQNKIKTIHVAGTNGKGSTSHMMASVLQEAGYKVGLYTSPHLKDFRERIKISGQMIAEESVISFVKDNATIIEEVKPSFFEITVAMAFDYYAKAKVDVAVIETGLGGRLDSTNIITPLVSVITNIGLDHQAMLGNTLELIAYEKAGIIKHKIPTIIGRTQNETTPVFEQKAKDMNSPILFVGDKFYPNYELDLKGHYQSENAKTAFWALELLKPDFDIKKQHLEKGFSNVIKNTGLLGRWHVLNTVPLTIADTAHNEDGLNAVLTQIKEQDYEHLHCVLGFVNDKDVAKILKVFPKNASFYYAKPQIPRGMENDELLKITKKCQREGKFFDSVKDALEAAKHKASDKDMVYVGGSTFVVAEVV